MQGIDESIKRNRYWSTHMDEWVADILPDVTLSAQQLNACYEINKLIKAKLNYFNKYDLTEEEKEYNNKIGLSIMAGHFTGKDFWCALLNFFFLFVFPNPKILCTAPTNHQLRDVLWAEFSKVMRLAKQSRPNTKRTQTILQEMFEWQTEKVFLKTKKGQEWFSVARSVNLRASEDEQAETLAGVNEAYKLYILDEWSDIPDPVMKPMEGSLGGALNIVVGIFNPTRNTGAAWKSQYDDREDRWIKLRWNAEESELVSKAHVENMRDKYGEDSNPYRIRVLGLPPKTEEDAFFPIEWILDAVDREILIDDDDPIIKGVDIGAGGDESVIATRKGGKIYPLKRKSTALKAELVSWVLHDFDNDQADFLFGDVCTIGWGPMEDIRRERGKKIVSVDSRGVPRNEMYLNKRAEMYGNLKDALENKSVSLPNDKDLIDQLMFIKKDISIYNKKGRIQLMGKTKVRKQLGRSTDDADAVAMLYAEPNIIYKHRLREELIINAPSYRFGNAGSEMQEMRRIA